MSILNDNRRFSDNEEERLEWENEMKSEFRRQEYYDQEHEFNEDEDGGRIQD